MLHPFKVGQNSKLHRMWCAPPYLPENGSCAIADIMIEHRVRGLVGRWRVECCEAASRFEKTIIHGDIPLLVLWILWNYDDSGDPNVGE